MALSICSITLGISSRANDQSNNQLIAWWSTTVCGRQSYYSIPKEWFDRNAKWMRSISTINAIDQHFVWLFFGEAVGDFVSERKRPRFKPKHELCNALAMLSEVQLMISKNTSLPPWSFSWIWCEDLTTKDQQTDQLKAQSSAQISRFHTMPDLLHFLK